jgi:hypothetical protein
MVRNLERGQGLTWSVALEGGGGGEKGKYS